jgi:hypothetical protein
MATPVPIVRCRLGARADESPSSTLRYVPLAEFELWKHLMETRHRREVRVETVSVWIPEEAAVWNSGFAAEELEPVLRVRIDLPGPHGVSVPVERYFPAETYPRAQEAWLGHLTAAVGPKRVVATPGYVVPPGEPRTVPATRLSA